MAADFLFYLWAVLSNWVIIVTTASPFVLDEFFKRIWPRFRIWLENTFSAKSRRRWEIAIMIAGFLFANFLAFENEHQARKNAENKLMTQASISGGEELKNLQADLEETRADSADKLKKQQQEIESLKKQGYAGAVISSTNGTLVAASVTGITGPYSYALPTTTNAWCSVFNDGPVWTTTNYVTIGTSSNIFISPANPSGTNGPYKLNAIPMPGAALITFRVSASNSNIIIVQ